MPSRDPLTAAHLEWLGFVQPRGLVVSAPALVEAGAILDRSDRKSWRRVAAWHERVGGDSERRADFGDFASAVLGWEFTPRGYAGGEVGPVPANLETTLRGTGETVRPDFAVRSALRPVVTPQTPEGQVAETQAPYDAWQLLVQTVPAGGGFDMAPQSGGTTAHQRMERLLRDQEIPAGLLFDGDALRLISAPRGESSGWLDFRLADMAQPAGRPIASALRMLLGQRRLLTGPSDHRLVSLLRNSRKYQNEVSERLSEQVLHALYELLRGLQAADDASKGHLLRQTLSEEPDSVYGALLTLVLRLVFLLYAEQRDLLPTENPTFLRCYSLAALHDRLRDDASRHPDTMDQRYGAWPQLLALFRLVNDGIDRAGLRLPGRPGGLFDPDRFPFLEGRPRRHKRRDGEAITAPLLSDGAIYRALAKLLVLDGERISYRALDVEHIGSVYETMMGFRLERATGRSLAITAPKKGGAPTVVDLEALLQKPPAQRYRWLLDRTDRKVRDSVVADLRGAADLDSLHAALDPVADRNATPDLVPAGAMILQPTNERRRSGSHYTPRELTEPIVRRTLEPILRRLAGEAGDSPTPRQILALRVCDPAVGSGAFLVEACRYLGARLVESWRRSGLPRDLPPDADERLHAMRLVARQCLYGVDKNPLAIDLAKLSLHLVTLSRDHPLTFLDHALRHGDSLVGMSLSQIRTFQWGAGRRTVPLTLEKDLLDSALEGTNEYRRRIRDAGPGTDQETLRRWLRDALNASDRARFLGDLLTSAFFEESTPAKRTRRRNDYAAAIRDGSADRERPRIESRRRADASFAPFHWELEFPEVFARKDPGFDAIVGNPPFLGGKRISTILGTGYRDWLADMHSDGSRGADLAAHFFRRAFLLLRRDGAFGLIATDTIAEGDTRFTGLRWICENGGDIYDAQRSLPWPGASAAISVSIVHLTRGRYPGQRRLDAREVDLITAFLFHRGGHSDPRRLPENKDYSFVGSFLRGMGFTFDDADPKGAASPLSVMDRLLQEDPRNGEIVFPYIGGEELTGSPTHAHRRYAINFQDWPLRRDKIGGSWTSADEDRRHYLRRRPVVPDDYPDPVAADWPTLLAIVENRVKPLRQALTPSPTNATHRERWWCFGRHRPKLARAAASLERVLAVSALAQHHALAFLPSRMVYAHALILFPFDTYAAFCALQARPHDIWSAFLGGSRGQGRSYTPSDCLETFPFPPSWDRRKNLVTAGAAYYAHRSATMTRRGEGLTTIYNRFHDPEEHSEDITRLRELHSEMDSAVFAAYRWSNIPTDCYFLPGPGSPHVAVTDQSPRLRYRWPNEIHDEVLARLLALNAARAAGDTGPDGASGVL